MTVIDLNRVRPLVTEEVADLPSGAFPLLDGLAPSAPFPTHALGPLARAADAIAAKVQTPPAMAANAVLGVAALAAQAHADIEVERGRAKPLSLFLITVAKSGDRKSGVDEEAMKGVRDYESDLRADSARNALSARNARDAWESARRKITNNGKLSYEQKRIELDRLGEEPPRPLRPYVVPPTDSTVPGLIRALPDHHASLGLFSDEGGMFFSGHSMQEDNATASAAIISRLWDRGEASRLRAASDDQYLNVAGRRVSLHMAAQPETTLAFLQNRKLRDQGLTARLLVAAPTSLIGSRPHREADEQDVEAIEGFRVRIGRILRAGKPMREGERNELSPPTIGWDTAAREELIRWKDAVEVECGPDGRYEGIQSLGCKAVEHAARIAGVLTVVEAFDNFETSMAGARVTLATVRNAITLMEWYLGEALRLAGLAGLDPDEEAANRLSDWARTAGPFKRADARGAFRHGGRFDRGMKAIDRYLALLVDAGHLIVGADDRTYNHVKPDKRRFRSA